MRFSLCLFLIRFVWEAGGEGGRGSINRVGTGVLGLVKLGLLRCYECTEA